MKTYFFIVPQSIAASMIATAVQRDPSGPWVKYSVALSPNGQLPITHYGATRMLSPSSAAMALQLVSENPGAIAKEWDVKANPTAFNDTLTELGLQRISNP